MAVDCGSRIARRGISAKSPIWYLSVRLAVLDHGGEADLRAGSRGGRDARQRRQLERAPSAVVRARQAVVALPFARAAAVREEHVGDLRAVHHRAAAEREEGVGAALAGELRDLRDDGAVGVLRHGVEDRGDLEAAVGQAVGDAVDETGGADHGVGDEQHPPRALLGELEAGGGEQVAPGDHPGRGGELVEVLEARHLAVVGRLAQGRSRSLSAGRCAATTPRPGRCGRPPRVAPCSAERPASSAAPAAGSSPPAPSP